jgi:hypothetical protein
MSNRNNDVFSVLVESECDGNFFSSGNTIEELSNGQIGAFDAATNLSVDAFTNPMPNEIFFAQAYQKNNGSTDFRFSAGQVIQRKGVVGFTEVSCTEGSPMEVTVGNFRAECDTEYGIRVEFRNAKINRIQGYNQFSKAYMVKTPCCDDCAEGCGSLDANVLSQLMVAAINSDESGLVQAVFVARQSIDSGDHGTSTDYSTGDVVSAADVAELIVFNSTAVAADQVFADFKLISQPLSIGSFCQVNLHYYKLLETTLIVSLIEGFGCSGATTINQYPTFAQGTGINIQQKEYHASGWAGSGPYKLSQVTGTAYGNITYLADKNTSYNQVILEYNQSSESGWQEYSNPLSTVFAFPCDNEDCEDTQGGLVNFLQAWTTNTPLEVLAPIV